MKSFLSLLACCLFVTMANAQLMPSFADSIRQVYQIPELAYAVIGSDSVYEKSVEGVRRINTELWASNSDRFHIGSNTKAITSCIAATLVQQGILQWNTTFVSLFPELKSRCRKEYLNMTLEELLTFRGKLPAYTYTFAKPERKNIKGNEAQQRYALAKYFLAQVPMQEQNGLTPSNADYILAGLMLEKSSGKSYKELVMDFGNKLHIHFGFDYPNLQDTSQTWGHDIALKPIAPSYNYKLNWLLSAGNINVSLSDYILFIQMLLQSLQGKSQIFSKETTEKLLFGKPHFAFGWFNEMDTATGYHIAFNEGNAGAFITKVKISKEQHKAIIIFTNAATSSTLEGINVLEDYLEKKYTTSVVERSTQP